MSIFWKVVRNKAKLHYLIWICLFISGCATQAYRPQPLPFEVAVETMAADIFNQVAKQQGILEGLQTRIFVTDPVIDADTGEVTSISKKIAELMTTKAQDIDSRFVLTEMSQANLAKAAYVVTGTMQLAQYQQGEAKIPHLFMSVVNRSSGQVVAHSEAWISDAKLEFKPVPMYQDSPMYIKDRRVDALIATAHAVAGSVAQREYFNTLNASALLDEASKAYDKGDYKAALGLFADAAARDDGQVMKTYSGLYQSFFKLGDLQSAEDAFSTLTKFGLKVGNISVKFLFAVNDVEFFNNEKLREYPIWLRQIAKTIKESDACIKLVGHASRSGSTDYNISLSKRRADHLKQHLEQEVKEPLLKVQTNGVGFAENIIGTGTNDDRDAIDRRVEFKVAKCTGS